MEAPGDCRVSIQRVGGSGRGRSKCEVNYYIDDINLTMLKYTYKGCLVLFLSEKELRLFCFVFLNWTPGTQREDRW